MLDLFFWRTLQKINGDACCLKWLDFVEGLQEQFEGIQCSIKPTTENGSNNYGKQRVSDENSGIMRPSCASLMIGETLQGGIKTAENVKFIQNDISSTGNHTSVHLHRTFLSRGASLPNLLATSNTCVILPDLTRCGTIAMNDDKFHIW